MNFKNVKRSTMIFALAASFILPHSPHMVWAKTGTASFPLDLFPEDNSDDDTGLSPTNPTMPSTGSSNNNNNNNTRPNNGNNGSTRSTSTAPATRPQAGTKMNAARVPEAYSCPLFDNRPHSELIAAIDALNKEVKASPECSGTPSAKSLEDNGNAIKESIGVLQKIMDTQDPNAVNTNQIDQSMTAALQAVGNLGDIVNNNSFLNSKCGRQTMSTGKVLLALNDVINGMAPYALFAVSMSAALAPALPFVLGGAIATSGISAVAKMIDQNTLDMTNPEHRKAVLQNTCQFTKVAKKVRFMQLAQSGKIDKITQELEQSVDLYNAKFANPSRELSALLKYRDTATKVSEAVENQLASDRADLATVEQQIGQNNDDVMVCTLSNELVNWARDGKTFPASAFLNLQAATAQGDRAQKLQSVTMATLHATSMKKIADYAAKSSEDENALKLCAQAGRSWLSGVRQSISMTGAVVNKSKSDLETELSRSAEYRQWKIQFNRIEVEKVTIKRVEKAMQELAKDNSIIDRSELAQRMVNLKSGLFGSRSAWSWGTPPVLAWINHTKSMHDQAVSAFITGMREVRNDSYSLTDAGRGKHIKYTVGGTPYTDPKAQVEANKISQVLGNINLTELPVGSREQELVCQKLESAWLDWSAAIDHLGAVQFFCDMIDPVLDVKMDSSVVIACRGYGQLNGTTYRESIVNQAKATLVRKGYQADATLVSKKLKELQCPMPAVSVMNQ
ncbi:hypothetical protein [Bdellovibrio sp. BCCA]|uniref:hypothetical protein n=1 Tax=Bdellovibrio sp. BCCA TaxID=3136281 RepID=UPI0030F14006